MQSVDNPFTCPAAMFGPTMSVLNELAGFPQGLLIVYVIFVVPALSAVTIPVDELTVATDVLVLLQLPFPVPLLVYVAVIPIQRDDVPLTVPEFTIGFTVNVLEDDTIPELQDIVYVIIVDPTLMAVTIPVNELTIATDVLLLLQLPPASPVLL